MQQCPRYLQYLSTVKTESNGKLSIVAHITQNQNNSNNANAILTFNERVTEIFETACDKVNSAKIDDEQKDSISGRLINLEKELKKEETVRDKSKIERLGIWIKQNASWVFPTIQPIITEVIKHT